MWLRLRNQPKGTFSPIRARQDNYSNGASQAKNPEDEDYYQKFCLRKTLQGKVAIETQERWDKEDPMALASIRTHT